MNNSITVSSNGTNGKVNVAADTAQYWSQKSREWAVNPDLVDREDYSSKYYAKKSKESADVATTAKNDIEASKTEFDNSYNEKSQALNNQYSNYSSELTTQKTEAITDIENKTEGLTDLYNEYTQNITTQETQAIQNITDKETESIANIETSTQTEIGKINSAGQTQINNIKQTGSEWGKIQGDITNQTDLKEQLALKQDKCIHIIDSYINGTSGYRIWSDGYCKQWGVGVGNASIEFLKTFANTNYNVSFGITCTDENAYTPTVQTITKNKSSMHVSARINGAGVSTLTYDWKVCGYLG